MNAFASRTVVEHLARGACAAVLVGLSVRLLSSPDLLGVAAAVVSLAVAAVLLRGCPLCWFVGLFETASASIREGDHP